MSKLPQPNDSLSRRLAEIEARMARVEARTPFYGTGMHPNGAGGIDSDNFQTGTSGYRFDSAGNAEFNELTLRGGIIGNDALAEPVRPARIHDDASNFTVSTAWSSILSGSITVPSGYTQALILNMGVGATAYNATAAVDFLYTRSLVNGSTLGGWAIGSVDVDASGTGVSYDLRTGLLTGLASGSTISFVGQVSSAFGNWGSTGGNVANLDVVMLWLK